MATETLPNGYCGLLIQKSCPHANARLTYRGFITSPEFLPELASSGTSTLTLSERRRQGPGPGRGVNQQILTNLDKMIGEIEKDNEAEVPDAG